MAELQADGVFEEAEGNIRQQLMAAAQLARSAVQARQDAAQRATRRDLEEARQLQAQIDAQRVCYVGDDLVDLPVLRAVGFAVTVPEARAEVKAVAHHVTERSAGFGAVRDVVEMLLRARGAFDDVLRRYGGP